jgi:hypothetical protein
MNDLNSKKSDLISSFILILIAILVMAYSLTLDVPGNISTAPGLLPFITSFILFFLASLLFFKSFQSRASIHLKNDFAQLLNYESTPRTLLLFIIVISYVLCVGRVNFELSFEFFSLPLLFSSYEFFSILFVTLIAKIFWGASLIRCLVVVFLTVESLALIFRYGFGILMPESF